MVSILLVYTLRIPRDRNGCNLLAEIKKGRLAMISIFGFAMKEFVSKTGVIDETPLFFFALDDTFKM